MKHKLNPEQAKVLTEINTRLERVKKELRLAYTLVGVDPDKVVGGELGQDPHLMLAD